MSETADIVRKLRDIRLDKQLSPTELSERLGMSPQYVNQMEHRVLRKGGDVGLGVIVRYCRVLGLRLSYIEEEVADGGR